MMGHYRHLPVEQLNEVFPRLEGVSIEVTDECNGCGECVDKCYVKAIKIVEGRAVQSEKCRGCGRCATFCPNGAVKIEIKDRTFKDQALSRISSYVDFD